MAARTARLIGLAVLLRLGAYARVQVDSTGNFVDESGRQMIFHGVNVVEKAWPWHPSRGKFDSRSSLNGKDISDLRNWGFNVVRLGMMWPGAVATATADRIADVGGLTGVEPVEGSYNATYLSVMRGLVTELYEAGIYTIIDFHQVPGRCGNEAGDTTSDVAASCCKLPCPAL